MIVFWDTWAILQPIGIWLPPTSTSAFILSISFKFCYLFEIKFISINFFIISMILSFNKHKIVGLLLQMKRCKEEEKKQLFMIVVCNVTVISNQRILSVFLKKPWLFSFLPEKQQKILQWNSVITNSVVNEHSVITNRFLSKIGQFSTQINPVITNPGYKEQKLPVPSCSFSFDCIFLEKVYNF
jgi:hypothetical protein